VCGGREQGTASPEDARIQILGNPARGGGFAVFCRHCFQPKCLEVCPQGAVSRDKAGLVRINKALCVNCGLCREVCAEAAPLRSPSGDIRKCDLCGGKPQCAEACPQNALEYTGGKKLRWISWLRWPAQAASFLLLVVLLIGSVCSLSIAALNILCPAGLIQNIASSKTILLTTLGSALFLLLLALLAGRLFCGWLCPLGFVLDLWDKAIGLKKNAGRDQAARIAGIIPAPLRNLSFFANRNNKYGVLAGAVAASAMTGNQSFCAVCPIGVVCRGYGLDSALGGAELVIIPLVAAMDLGRSRRSWCRYFCPVGAFFALLARFAPVSLEIGADRCRKFSCKRCAEVCPTGIIDGTALQEGGKPRVWKAECIMCLRCVDICPHKAAKLRFGLPGFAGIRKRSARIAALPEAPAGGRP
jgi:ferredoxin-type protein NapH